MEGTKPQRKRINRVFKSLHKPLTYLGIERTLFFFICVGAVGAFNLFNSLLAGVAIFLGGFAFGHWVTNTDPNLLGSCGARQLSGEQLLSEYRLLVSQNHIKLSLQIGSPLTKRKAQKLGAAKSSKQQIVIGCVLDVVSHCRCSRCIEGRPRDRPAPGRLCQLKLAFPRI
jgi:hypothetical protein